jgi:hypothetical protein
MKANIFLFVITSCFFTNLIFAQTPRINTQKDLLLVQYDCKTDVDDLHSVAAFSTIIAAQKYSKLNYHAVAGTYGVQEGLYVPPNDLFELAFGDQWSDAHKDFEKALNEVAGKVEATLKKDGNIWIAEAGQSDFTAAVVKAVQAVMPGINTTKRIHVVQHSNWNEEVTTPEKLAFVKKGTSYHKISDGNAVGNGTPGFRTAKKVDWQKQIIDPKLVKIWETALKLSNRYNGKEGRYNNEAIAAGGLDFSDTAEVCWMLGLENIDDAEAFFRYFAK